MGELEILQQETKLAGDLLRGFAAQRRGEVVSRLSLAMTAALRQLFGPDWAATVGAPDAKSAKAAVEVRVTGYAEARPDRLYTGEVKAGFGFSTRNVVDFSLWLELFWLLLQVRPGILPVVLWDEPFININPVRYAAAAEVLAGCGELGIQVIAPTNIPEMIPAGAVVVNVSTGEVTQE